MFEVLDKSQLIYKISQFGASLNFSAPPPATKPKSATVAYFI